MPTRGKLLKVWDNDKNWALVIDVDEHGEHKLNLWNKRFAGIDSKENPVVCDVHDFVGKRIVYTAKAGKPKEDGTDDRWPSTIEEIALEGEQPEKSIREMAEDIAKREEQDAALAAKITREASQAEPIHETYQDPVQGKCDDLRRLTMESLNAQAKVTNEIIRLFELQ
jgi:hypothetical protein